MISTNPQNQETLPEQSGRLFPLMHQQPTGLDSFIDNIMIRFRADLREILPSFRGVITTSGITILSDSRKDLERWTSLLAAGSLSREEFEWLVQARVHLAEMKSLLLAGITLARIDEIRMSLVNSITSTAFHLIGI